MRQALLTDEVFEYEHGVSREKHYFKFRVDHLEISKKQRQVVRIIDVSDSVLYDQSREKNELLSIINATVSHELRNPLNSITP